MTMFSDPKTVSDYADKPARLVPGFADMQRMAGLLLAERVGHDAQILVLGAGGGLELRVFADWQPGWSFVGVDPSSEMLALAAQTAAAHAARIDLIHGYIDTAPLGPFDAATCLLTLHFLPREARVQTLLHLRMRMKSGAPLVIAHHSFSQDDNEKDIWLARYAAFAALSGVPPDKAENAGRAIGKRLPLLAPKDDEDALRQAGFVNIQLFYAAFTFRGWVAYAP